MLPRTPAAKLGIVAAGFFAAFVAAVVAVYFRQKLTDGPDAIASSGMYAGGDMLLGFGVLGLLSLGPLALALYWLRPVPRFWTLLAGAAALVVLTGPPALVLAGGSPRTVGNWAILGVMRILLMPLAALALAVCGLFAPAPRPRWILIAMALVEGGLFAGVVIVKFILPPH